MKFLSSKIKNPALKPDKKHIYQEQNKNINFITFIQQCTRGLSHGN